MSFTTGKVLGGCPPNVPVTESPELKVVFGTDGVLYVKDANGNIQPLSELIPSSGGGAL